MPLCPDKKFKKLIPNWPQYLDRTLSYAEEVDAISNYLRYQRYPPKFNNNNKRWLRRRSKSFTLVEKGDVFYLQKDGRVCVADAEEQRRITMKAHRGLGDSHFGRDKTLKNIISRYYWRSIYKDVCALTETCPTCKRSSRSRPKSNTNLAIKLHKYVDAQPEERLHIRKIPKQRIDFRRSQKQANQRQQVRNSPESSGQRLDVSSSRSLPTCTPGEATEHLQGELGVPESTEQSGDILIRPNVPHTSALHAPGMPLPETVNVQASSKHQEEDMVIPTALRLVSILGATSRVPNGSKQSQDRTRRPTSWEPDTKGLLDLIKVTVKEAVKEANSEIHAKLNRLIADVTTIKEELGVVKQSVWHLESSGCDVSNTFTCEKEEIVSDEEGQTLTLEDVLA